MNSVEYFHRLAERVDALEDPADLNRLLDEVEFWYDALEPPFQDLAEDMIARLQARLQSLGSVDIRH